MYESGRRKKGARGVKPRTRGLSSRTSKEKIIPPSIIDTERAERLTEVLQHLYEVNKRVPIIVEGKKDLQALRDIGLIGDIIVLHGGKGLYEFSEEISEQYRRVIILMDWDEKGEKLFKSLSKHLEGMWEEFSAFREVIKLICQKEIKDIEGIPVLLERIAGARVKVGEEETGEFSR